MSNPAREFLTNLFLICRRRSDHLLPADPEEYDVSDECAALPIRQPSVCIPSGKLDAAHLPIGHPAAPVRKHSFRICRGSYSQLQKVWTARNDQKSNLSIFSQLFSYPMFQTNLRHQFCLKT